MKPLLACNIKNINEVKFPCYVSPKYDGVRCLVFSDGRVLARSLKPIRNDYLRAALKTLVEYIPEGSFLDGEIMVGQNIQETTSAVMSVNGAPQFEYYVFDFVEADPLPFSERLKHLEKVVNAIHTDCLYPITLISQTLVSDAESVKEKYAEFLDIGHEGIILRSPSGIYKHGRSTPREGFFGKIKPTADAEFTILEVNQKFTNTNPVQTNELGHSKRSSAKEGMVPLEQIGSFLVTDGKMTFSVGSGLTAQQREDWWVIRDSLIGKTIKVKYMDYGMKDAVRQPIFVCFRDKIDL